MSTLKELTEEALKLTPEQKVELIGRIWESIEEQATPLTPAQAAELDRRWARYEADPSRAIPGEQVMARVRDAVARGERAGRASDDAV